MLLLQSLVPLACMQGIKSKARAIKCWREEKYLPNECCNIPFYTFLLSFFFILARKDVKNAEKDDFGWCVKLIAGPNKQHYTFC